MEVWFRTLTMRALHIYSLSSCWVRKLKVRIYYSIYMRNPDSQQILFWGTCPWEPHFQTTFSTLSLSLSLRLLSFLHKAFTFGLSITSLSHFSQSLLLWVAKLDCRLSESLRSASSLHSPSPQPNSLQSRWCLSFANACWVKRRSFPEVLGWSVSDPWSGSDLALPYLGPLLIKSLMSNRGLRISRKVGFQISAPELPKISAEFWEVGECCRNRFPASRHQEKFSHCAMNF